MKGLSFHFYITLHATLDLQLPEMQSALVPNLLKVAFYFLIYFSLCAYLFKKSLGAYQMRH